MNANGQGLQPGGGRMKYADELTALYRRAVADRLEVPAQNQNAEIERLRAILRELVDANDAAPACNVSQDGSSSVVRLLNAFRDAKAIVETAQRPSCREEKHNGTD